MLSSTNSDPEIGSAERYLASLFSLTGRVALVTGASRGVGLAMATALARAGASVTGFGRSPCAEGDPVEGLTYVQADVTDPVAFEEVCADVHGRAGRLDVLVNAAGISMSADSGAPLEVFDKTMATNLRAAYGCSLAVAPLMAAGGGGSIINVTSIGSVLGFPGNPGYVASKGGLRALTMALACDWGGRGIRVNNIAPGYIHTAMTARSHADPEMNLQRRRHTMLNRWGTPGDLVGAVIFLASDASSYVTGADLFVDGGWTALGMINQ